MAATTSWIQVMDNAFSLMVFNRFGSILSLTDSNADLTFVPKDLALRFVAEKRGSGTTEFLSAWRSSAMFDWARQNTAIARKGMQMEYIDSSAAGSKSGIVTVKAVPIKMSYKFWAWSRSLDKLALVTESYMKWIHDHPNMLIAYSGLYEMDMYLTFGETTDVTDYNIWDKNKNFCFEFPVEIEGWVLTSVVSPTIKKIIIDVFLREGNPLAPVDTLINEYIITSS
jgi:hypothetical protein